MGKMVICTSRSIAEEILIEPIDTIPQVEDDTTQTFIEPKMIFVKGGTLYYTGG